MDLLVDSDEYGRLFRPQLEFITDDKYNFTNGTGLFVTFRHDNKIETVRQDNDNLVIDGVTITSLDRAIEAKAILHIKNGIIDNLEIWCVTDNYPQTDLKKYILKQDWIGSTNRQIVVDK